MDIDAVSFDYIVLITVSVALGIIARILTLVVDYRQYPSYPNGYLIHLITGAVASGIGAIAVPAVIHKDFEAVTFLALAIEQFREVRRMENESLHALEETENISRGNAYIDGIAKTFEARNYFSLLVAFFASLTMTIVPRTILWINIFSGIAAGAVVFLILKNFSKGRTIGDIAEVKPGKIKVVGYELYVDDIFVSNHLGMETTRTLVEEQGIAAVLYAREERYRLILNYTGQRQAILFEAYRVLGLKRYHFTRRDYNSGRIVVVLVPIIHDEDAFIETIKRTPLLESIKKNYEVMESDFIKE